MSLKFMVFEKFMFLISTWKGGGGRNGIYLTLDNSMFGYGMGWSLNFDMKWRGVAKNYKSTFNFAPPPTHAINESPK